jgi:hypothetical protein
MTWPSSVEVVRKRNRGDLLGFLFPLTVADGDGGGGGGGATRQWWWWWWWWKW